MKNNITLLPERIPQKKVAAYARVSAETDRLSHSLAAQTDYYRQYIQSRADWRLVGIYADSFITGTDISRRQEFQRLIADCESGRVDIVLCKSISRFARNTVDLLNTVRRLKEIGVEVFFEKENISSLSKDGELLLTILAGFAQEESRAISENVKWGIRKTFSSGKSIMRNKAVFGYRYIEGKYRIVPEEAAAVGLIFGEYIKGVSLRKISLLLRQKGIKSTRGFDFSHNQIDYIVHNEIYAGNIVLQKTFVRDFITHSRAQNRGELPQYRYNNSHDPIIDPRTFSLAQAESRRRAALKAPKAFSGRLICANCGKPFSRFSNFGKYACWRCRRCRNAKLKEDRLKALFSVAGGAAGIYHALVHKNGAMEVEFTDGRKEKWQYE